MGANPSQTIRLWQQEGLLKDFSSQERKRLDEALTDSSPLPQDVATVVDEAVAEAAPLARDLGFPDFATWCDRYRSDGLPRDDGEPDPWALQTIKRVAGEVAPVSPNRLASTALAKRLLDLRCCDRIAPDAGRCVLYAVAQAALEYVRASGPRPQYVNTEMRKRSRNRAHLLACLALPLIRRLRSDTL